jgi:hypothetical protein
VDPNYYVAFNPVRFVPPEERGPAYEEMRDPYYVSILHAGEFLFVPEAFFFRVLAAVGELTLRLRRADGDAPPAWLRALEEATAQVRAAGAARDWTWRVEVVDRGDGPVPELRGGEEVSLLGSILSFMAPGALPDRLEGLAREVTLGANDIGFRFAADVLPPYFLDPDDVEVFIPGTAYKIPKAVFYAPVLGFVEAATRLPPPRSAGPDWADRLAAGIAALRRKVQTGTAP